MSKVVEARAEAARLYLDERLDLPEIAGRMGRSVEGVELLLTYGGVDIHAPRPAPAIPEPAAAPAPEPALPLAVAVTRAFAGARLACGEEPADTIAAHSCRVRVLAACALAAAGHVSKRQASRECAIGDLAQVAPSQWVKHGVTEEMIVAVVEFMATGAEPPVFVDMRPGAVAARQQAVRLAEAIRLYRDEGLSLEETGKRLDPPMAFTGVHRILKDAGVDTRPRGTQGNRPGHRNDGAPRKAPCPSSRPRPTRKPTVVTDAGRFVRMKAISDDIVRWTSQYVAQGVAVEYMAELFDCDAEALSRAVAA